MLYILIFFISIVVYPYVSLALYVITFAMIYRLSYKYFVLGFLISFCIDIIWGRLLFLESFGYILYAYIASLIFTRFSSVRDYGILICTFLYIIFFQIIFWIFDRATFSFSGAVKWSIIHMIVAVVFTLLMYSYTSFIQGKKGISISNLKRKK